MVSLNALDSPDSYTIAWIAALFIERAAAEAMLDERHAVPTGFTRHQTDANVYTWGRVGEHNIVIAALASGDYGTTSAATTASSLLASLPSIRIGLLVGIGGGIARPDEGHDIRLGDVVVSQPSGTIGGVCQYDLIKAKPGDKHERKGFLGRPPTVLLNALTSIQAYHEQKDSDVPCFLRMMLEKNPKMGKRSKQNPGYTYQGFDNDRLFKASCNHIPGLDCEGCDTADEIQRDSRDTTDPDIHYGTIASGNTLVTDAAKRDRIATDLGKDCICFEMEAAGLMNHFPCLVIRGICDYADSHKNDRWQRYASATAAAYAKELLAYVPALEVQETKRALEILQSVQQQIDSMQQTAVATKAVTDSVRSDLRTDKIRRLLCPPDSSTNANHARTLRHEGTGAWLLDNPVFQSWHSGSRQHLWLHGLAGCGKTVLSATVLDHLAKENDKLILNFFFDFSDTTKQTLDGMLRSLAFQLYQSGFDSAIHLDDLSQACQNGSVQPTTKALSDIVFMMLVVQKKVTIVLDALDESKKRDDVLQWIKDIVSRPDLVHLQLFYTSRPESELLRHIPPLIGKRNCLLLDKKAVNSDIRLWVTAQLSQRRDFTEKPLSQGLLEGIRRKVGDGADGMFRWAFCQLDSLARCPHEAAIVEALASLPLNLNETYRRMIASIPTRLKNDAIRLLQFLVYSNRPLSLAEAQEVIATQIENESRGFDIKRRLFCETDILDYCPGLVTVVHATDKELHLAHLSVKEYLLEENDFEITTASISITRTCLSYLTGINGSHREIKRNFPMARYAAELWTGHAALAQASEDISRVTVSFLERKATFQRWTRLYQADRSWDDNPGPPRSSRLYYACLLGLVAPARHLISKGEDVNAQGGQYGNALQAASFKGFQGIVKLLLDKGADINAQGGEYGNALQAASLGGHQEIVKLLLGKGADINAQSGRYDRYGNALQAASEEGHLEIVKLLLDKGADVNAQGGLYNNALQAASSGGHQEIIKLLLDNGADINTQHSLQAASEGGFQEITKLLLEKKEDINVQRRVLALSENGFQDIFKLLSDKGIKTPGDFPAALEGSYQEITNLLFGEGEGVNAQGGQYSNALQDASEDGHQEIVTLLLDKGEDVNAQGGQYSNALQAASKGGHQEIVKLLLDKGADINAQGGQYGNALQAASFRGCQRIVKLLLDKGANINAQGGEYSNALQAASERGHQEIIKLLLDKGADINAQGGQYGNALQAALEGGYQGIFKLFSGTGASAGMLSSNVIQTTPETGRQKIIKLLLDKGADINAQGGQYGNPLQAASRRGYLKIVKLLLDKGVNVNTQGGYYSNPLQAASEAGYLEIVKLLLDKGAGINIQGGAFDNPLLAASISGHQNIVKLLLGEGADVNAEGSNYGTALRAALHGGFQGIIKLLLDNGADANTQDDQYGNVLQVASERGYQGIINLLLDKGANINAQGGEYGNALQAASFKGFQGIVKLLLDKGANINTQGGEYGNALQAASERGHQEIVKLLQRNGAVTLSGQTVAH
ncbi:unnamed protein product [Penicillium discolor]